MNLLPKLFTTNFKLCRSRFSHTKIQNKSNEMTHSFFKQNHVLEIKFWWSICKIKILNMFFYISLFNSCKKLILNSRFNLITERNFKFNIKVFIVILNVKICDNSVVERKIPLQISSIRLPTAVRWNITALEIQLLFIVGKYVIASFLNHIDFQFSFHQTDDHRPYYYFLSIFS